MPLIACLSNGDKVQSTRTCILDLPNLPAGARAAHYIPSLVSHLLLSVVTMCNAACTVTFTKINCTIGYHGQTIICGNKCTRTGLWMVPLTKNAGDQAASPSATSNHAPLTTLPTTALVTNIDATSSAAKYAHYIHQIMCFPPASTLLRVKEYSRAEGVSPKFGVA